MNLEQTISFGAPRSKTLGLGFFYPQYIKAGGVGSGCKGAHCGRPRTKDEGRQSKALATHKPVDREKRNKALKVQNEVARALGGQESSDNSAFDILLSKSRIGIEVKTLIDAKRNAITVHPSSRERKEKTAKQMKLKSVYMVIVDQRTSSTRIYYAKGIGSYRLNAKKSSLTEVKSLSDLKKVIK